MYPDEYPKSDFPWTLYFQGVEMPKWANCWHWQGVADSNVDWYVDQVHGRLDHIGVVESEEADNFIIVAQQVLLSLIDHRESFTTVPEGSAEQTAAIYANLLVGVQKMIQIAEGEEVVFWASGYEADKRMLEDAITRFKLGPGHPQYFEPPHRQRRRRERISDLNWQRKELRRRLPTIGPNKELKRFIHALKDRKC